MPILALAALLLFGGDIPRPVEDDAIVNLSIAAAESFGADPAYNASKRVIFMGGTFIGPGGIECAIGNTWRNGSLSQFEVTCP